MQEVAHQPQDAQPEEDAHEGRQVGRRLERGHRHQDAQPQRQHQLALEGCGDRAMPRRRIIRRDDGAAPRGDGGHGQRDEQADERGHEYGFHEGQGRDLPADPQHGGRDVADG